MGCLLGVELRVEGMNEEHSDEHVLGVKALPFLCLHKLLLYIGYLVHCEVSLLRLA